MLAFGVQSVIVSAYLEMMVGQPTERYTILRPPCLVEIGSPRTAEEAQIICDVAPNLVALPTNDFQVDRPGNHAVAFVGHNPHTLDRYLTSASHAFGRPEGKIGLVTHPFLDMRFVPNYSEIVRYYPDTAAIALQDDEEWWIRGLPLEAYIPDERCWIVTMKYDGYGSYHIRVATNGARISNVLATDIHGTECPTITGDSSMLELGCSGSPVLQRDDTGKLIGVGALHGLSTDEETMFTPIPSVLYQNIPGNCLG